MKKIKSAPDYVVDLLQREDWQKPDRPYIKPSSLAKGCLLYVAFELQGRPKPPMDARVGRILSVGTDSHRRLQRMLARACLAQELYFIVPEYRIHGYVDGVLYISPEKAPASAPEAAGFWALEFKTTAGSEFDKVKAAKMAKEEHARQAQIYLWGLERYLEGLLPLKGAIIYYENRDTLEHAAFEVTPDPEGIEDLMARVRKMLDGLDGETLPDDHLSEDHWGHRYCPYLEICEPGQRAMEWQAKQPRELPDEVLANMIAKRIIAKKGAEKMTEKKQKKGQRSLAELADELEWE